MLLPCFRIRSLAFLLALGVAACGGKGPSEERTASPAPPQHRAQRWTPNASPTPPRNPASEARRGKKVYVAELGTSLSVFPSVFAPHRSNVPFRQFLLASDLAWAKDVLDIGTGSGVLGLLVLKRNAGHVVATDVNEAAIRNASWNAEQLGYGSRFEARLVPLDRSGAFSVIGPSERFDLILSNPPWYQGTPRTMKDRAIYDEDYALLRSLLSGLKDHLQPGGKAWLEYSSHEAREIIAKEAPAHSLTQQAVVENGSYAVIELQPR